MNEVKEKAKPTYVWYRDNKMIGTILLFVIISLQIFGFLRVPVLSTIHAYTIGMLFGWYSPLFYVYTAYFALKMMFGDKVTLPKWIKLNHFTYWFVAISIIFVSVTLLFPYYQVKLRDGFTIWGTQPWHSFDTWFADFTAKSAWAPANTNGGIIGAFLFSLTASFSSGIGAMIISIILLALSLSIVLTGSFIGFYKNLMHKRTTELNKNEEMAKNEISIDHLTKKVPEDKTLIQEEKAQKADDNQIDDFPFDDPFK